MQKIVVNDNNFERIDKYLAKKVDLSREKIQDLVKNGLILVNNETVKANYIVKENDEITIYEEEKRNSPFEGTDIPVDIVYEDDDIIVVNKQSGLTVHPGSGNTSNTLVNALIHYNKKLSKMGGLERPGVVHRIDKDTSGLIILAKNDKTHRILADYFKNKTIKRTYIALVKGIINEASGTIDAPIGRDEKNRLRMSVTDKNSKRAVTHFKVLKRYKRYTLLELELETGRTHQIRVHMKYINHPVYNDPLYTNDSTTEFGQFLHSAKMELIHPITKKLLKFEAPLPREFQEFLHELE